MVSQYAHWEESQKDFGRARSVWERALDVDYTNTNFWLKVNFQTQWQLQHAWFIIPV